MFNNVHAHSEERCWCFPVVQHIGNADIVEHNTDSELAEIIDCVVNHTPIHLSSVPEKVFEIAKCEICGGWHLMSKGKKVLCPAQDTPSQSC